MAGRTPKRAIVLGGGGTLWDDIEQARALFEPDLVIACNHAGRDYPGRVDHWVTMHPDLRSRWTGERIKNGFPPAGRLWHPRHRGIQPDSTAIESWAGSSGMLCVAVAYELRCSHIVLCGVPMDKMAGHYDDPKPWTEARQYHAVWERLRPRIKGRVRSMSGWTRDRLGAPTEEWLNADTP